ncbi:hypothetical protein M0804_013840 [Polistes exclamans]|nr:hypothetical protein M0804_013840 [Polistes exclamans]
MYLDNSSQLSSIIFITSSLGMLVKRDITSSDTSMYPSAAWASKSQNVLPRKTPSYPNIILHKIKVKRQAKARWQKNKTRSNTRLLNKLTEDVKHSIRYHNNAEFERYLTSFSSNENTNYSLWKTAKRFKRPVKSMSAIRNIDSS